MIGSVCMSFHLFGCVEYVGCDPIQCLKHRYYQDQINCYYTSSLPICGLNLQSKASLYIILVTFWLVIYVSTIWRLTLIQIWSEAHEIIQAIEWSIVSIWIPWQWLRTCRSSQFCSSLVLECRLRSKARIFSKWF